MSSQNALAWDDWGWKVEVGMKVGQVGITGDTKVKYVRGMVTAINPVIILGKSDITQVMWIIQTTRGTAATIIL